MTWSIPHFRIWIQKIFGRPSEVYIRVCITMNGKMKNAENSSAKYKHILTRFIFRYTRKYGTRNIWAPSAIYSYFSLKKLDVRISELTESKIQFNLRNHNHAFYAHWHYKLVLRLSEKKCSSANIYEYICFHSIQPYKCWWANLPIFQLSTQLRPSCKLKCIITFTLHQFNLFSITQHN